MSEHTPTPWKADIRTGCLAIYPASEDHNCLDGFSQRGIMFQGGFGERAPESIYQSVTPLQVANAEYIVLSCNLHDALVAALKKIADEHTDYRGMDQYSIGVADGHRCAGEIARAALELVESQIRQTTGPK